MTVFDYIFYRTYMYYRRKRDSGAASAASSVVSLFQCFFVIDIFVIVRVFYEYSIPSNFNKFWGLALFIPIGIFNWKRYEKNLDSKQLRKRWNEEDKKEKIVYGRLIVTILIILLLVPVLYGVIRHNIMDGKSFWNP